MNVTIIYGNSEKLATYHCVRLLISRLRINIPINTTEIYLYKDLFYYKNSSSDKSSIKKYSTNINLVLKSLINSDLIIFASPVSSCDISPEMTHFLNNLSRAIASKSYLMKNKIGLSISTTAGAGLFHATKKLQRTLKFFGIQNTLKFSKTIYEQNWEEVNTKTKKQIGEKILKLSYKILHLYKNLSPSPHSNFNNIESNITSLDIKPLSKANHRHIINFNYFKKHTPFYRSKHNSIYN